MPADPPPEPPPRHKRRPRYSGKHPRRFEEKYKEHDPDRHPDTVAKVLASGKTPAGTHRPIMVAEILAALDPKPGDIAVDCTLGHGGHAREILAGIQPAGLLIGIDADPLELPRTGARLRAAGFGPETFVTCRSNFAGLAQVLAMHGVAGADVLIADLGVSSMQLDDPARGFSVKLDGPLDMRMNPLRGQSAAALLEKIRPATLAAMLDENADEPHAAMLAPILAGRRFEGTSALNAAIRASLSMLKEDDLALTVRRVFQALRIAVNDEFSALDSLLRRLPDCLKPGGRAAILTFHSGEDRRVKKAFESGVRSRCYAEINAGVIRPQAAEVHSNPRASSAKLRWAKRAE